MNWRRVRRRFVLGGYKRVLRGAPRILILSEGGGKVFRGLSWGWAFAVPGCEPSGSFATLKTGWRVPGAHAVAAIRAARFFNFSEFRRDSGPKIASQSIVLHRFASFPRSAPPMPLENLHFHAWRADLPLSASIFRGDFRKS